MMAVDVGPPFQEAWEADVTGMLMTPAYVSTEAPAGDSPSAGNSAIPAAAEAGLPDFEVSAAPRVVYSSTLAARIPASRRALGDMTLQRIQSRLEIEVRNVGDAAASSYVEVSVTRLGDTAPEWVGAVPFNLGPGQVRRAVVRNTRADDAFAMYWTPKYAGIYIVSAVADPPTAEQPGGAVLESNDTDFNDPDPGGHFGNNAKFAAVHVHNRVPPRTGNGLGWLRSMVTRDQDGGPGSLVVSYFVADHAKYPRFGNLAERPLADLVNELEWRAYAYDNALAVILHASRRDFATARSILAEMRYLQDVDGGFASAWHAPRPKLFQADPVRRAGNAAWVILAIDWYTARSGDRQFLDMAKKAADWLLSLQNPDGSLRGGDDVVWVSNEHNFDALSALPPLARLLGPTEGGVYEQAAEAIRRYLQTQAWMNDEGRFRRGRNDDYPVADVQTWGVMALGPLGPNGEDYTRALDWLESHGRYTDPLYSATGVDFNAASPDTVSSEQTAIYATALASVRNLNPLFGQHYTYYLKQLARLRNPDGGVRYSSRPGDVDENPANRSITLESVAGTVWSSFAASRLNPFVVPAPAARWSAKITGTGNDRVLEIGYGSGTNFPQVGALHLKDGYLRLNYGADSGWGTSVILPPSLWSGGVYYQGAPVQARWRTAGNDLIVSFSGSIAGLGFSGSVRISPPSPDRDNIAARVTMNVRGDVALDARPGEAFKLVALSSMHVDAANWDAHHAFADGQEYPLPDSGWIVQPPAAARVFGLAGGTSSWKTDAPSVTVALAGPTPIAGWATSTSDPNDDNLSLWGASDTIVHSYVYDLFIRKGVY